MKKKHIFLLLMFLLTATALVAGWKLYSGLQEYDKARTTYEQLEEQTRKKSPPAADEMLIDRDFDRLEEVNPEIVAWITIPDTDVNYPVVQGDDNLYYLTHLPTGEYNASGSIFLDYRAAPDFSDPYSVLYGHNMKNGSMFTSLTNYEDQDFYDDHPEGCLITRDGTRTIAFFAGFLTEPGDPLWESGFGTFDEWIAKVHAKSTFSSERLPEPEDRIVALVTCSYEFDEARFVLLGILL